MMSFTARVLLVPGSKLATLFLPGGTLGEEDYNRVRLSGSLSAGRDPEDYSRVLGWVGNHECIDTENEGAGT